MKKINTYKLLGNGLPEKQFLAQRLEFSLDFAKRTIQHLIVDGNSASTDAPWHVRSEKIIAESAYLLIYAKASESYENVSLASSELLELLEPLARSKSTLVNICLNPALALDYAHAHICLSYLGLTDKNFDVILKRSLKDKKFVERRPYRMLEHEWLLEIWNSAHKKDVFNHFLPLSCLNNTLDLFSESSDGAYALTHAVMYFTFNDKKDQNGINIDTLLLQLEGLLVKYMDQQDYDIAGELLMAWVLIKKPFSTVALFALECLINIENRVGFLPVVNLDLSMIEGREKRERRTYIYSINYHTAYVMGLLVGSLLTNIEDIDIINNRPSFYPIKLSNWLEKELSKGAQSHWQEYFSSLDNDQKNDLVPWVYQVVLARNVKQHNYGTVKKILDLAKNHDLEFLEMSKQATELLHRLKYIF